MSAALWFTCDGVDLNDHCWMHDHDEAKLAQRAGPHYNCSRACLALKVEKRRLLSVDSFQLRFRSALVKVLR